MLHVVPLEAMFSKKGEETSLAGMRTFILSGYDYRYPQTCDNTINSIILLRKDLFQANKWN